MHNQQLTKGLAAIVVGYAIESRLATDAKVKRYILSEVTVPTRLKDLPIDYRLSKRIAMQLMAANQGTVYKSKGEYFYSPCVQLSLFPVGINNW